MNQQRIDAETYILFEIAGTTYGVSSRSVQQIEMIEHITPLPMLRRLSKALFSSAARSFLP
jgi:hypothetical protein